MYGEERDCARTYGKLMNTLTEAWPWISVQARLMDNVVNLSVRSLNGSLLLLSLQIIRIAGNTRPKSNNFLSLIPIAIISNSQFPLYQIGCNVGIPVLGTS